MRKLNENYNEVRMSATRNKKRCDVCGSNRHVRAWWKGNPPFLCEQCFLVNCYLDKCDVDFASPREQREIVEETKRVFKNRGYTEEELNKILRRLLPYKWLHKMFR